ncbi:sensor histidine kinase [Brachybacterium sp. YJGR34]|uniref:sensor histidine kinase n=1 Tax=Brachybacterium sp. YJGR34 TaxID=2059911 RepID=UPI000E0A7AE0|nr:histidine kinase [Brachybacterium sp. YJGR34]
MAADVRTMIVGGNLEGTDGEPRTWATNWPLHLLVIGNAVLSAVVSPGAATALLAAVWIAAYLAAHRVRVIRSVPVPGSGTVSVVVLSAIALALLAASGQGLNMFAAYLLVWVLLPTFRAGLIATLLLSTGMATVLLLGADGPDLAEIGIILAAAAASTLFSILLAAWFWRTELISHERQELARQLASTVRALESTREELARIEHRRGAEEEAARLAAEIHDTLAQSFTTITMLAQAARTSDASAQQLVRIEEVSRDGLAQARGLISRSQQLPDLAGSITRLAADLTERTGIRTRVEAGGWSPAPTRTEVVLLRTAQEALRNIEGHAEAATVGIRLGRGPGTALLEVADDGVGFSPELPTAGFGLTGMRARLVAEGGALEVDTARGRGTTLRAELPVGPDPAAAPGSTRAADEESSRAR